MRHFTVFISTGLLLAFSSAAHAYGYCRANDPTNHSAVEECPGYDYVTCQFVTNRCHWENRGERKTPERAQRKRR